MPGSGNLDQRDVGARGEHGAFVVGQPDLVPIAAHHPRRHAARRQPRRDPIRLLDAPEEPDVVTHQLPVDPPAVAAHLGHEAIVVAAWQPALHGRTERPPGGCPRHGADDRDARRQPEPAQADLFVPARERRRQQHERPRRHAGDGQFDGDVGEVAVADDDIAADVVEERRGELDVGGDADVRGAGATAEPGRRGGDEPDAARRRPRVGQHVGVELRRALRARAGAAPSAPGPRRPAATSSQPAPLRPPHPGLSTSANQRPGAALWHDPDMTLAAGTATWKVAPSAGFVVADPEGLVGLEQVTKFDFRVTTGFEFKDEQFRQRLIDSIVRNRKLGKTTAEAAQMVDTACTFTVTGTSADESDLASIPVFMRWFVNTYGLHTLAALIHDNLIVDKPNDGPLKSDALSDRFFREMMRCAGVRWLSVGSCGRPSRCAPAGPPAASGRLSSSCGACWRRLGIGAVRLVDRRLLRWAAWDRARVDAADRHRVAARRRAAVGPASSAPASSPPSPRCGSSRRRSSARRLPRVPPVLEAGARHVLRLR